jgi:methylase of polypeptide subunit release factors
LADALLQLSGTWTKSPKLWVQCAVFDGAASMKGSLHRPPAVSDARIAASLACRCVEVGCGSGYVITSAVRIVAARNGGACQFIATDISEPALTATGATLDAHKVHGANDLPKRPCVVAAMSTANAG